jgi:hypothetical protein
VKYAQSFPMWNSAKGAPQRRGLESAAMVLVLVVFNPGSATFFPRGLIGLFQYCREGIILAAGVSIYGEGLWLLSRG